MEREAKGLASTASIGTNGVGFPIPSREDCSFTATSTTCSSSSTTSSSSRSTSPVFLRNVQAAFKRHRSIAPMETNLMARRVLPQQLEKAKGSSLGEKRKSKIISSSQAQTLKSSIGHKKDGGGIARGIHDGASIMGPRRVLPSQLDKAKGYLVNVKRPREVVSLSQIHKVNTQVGEKEEAVPVVGETQEDASITPTSLSGTITSVHGENYISYGAQGIQHKHNNCTREGNAKVSTDLKSQHAPVANTSKKVQFALINSSTSQEMEWDTGSQVENSNITSNEPNHQVSRNMETNDCNRKPSLLGQLHQFRNFLQSDVHIPMTQSSYMGSSCVTTTSLFATSTPIINSTTDYSGSQRESTHCAVIRSSADAKLNPQLVNQVDGIQQSSSLSVVSSVTLREQLSSVVQPPSFVSDPQVGFNERHQNIVPTETEVSKEPSPVEGKSMGVNRPSGDDVNVALSCLQSNNSSSKNKLVPSKVGKVEKMDKGAPAPRKKHYDPDLFFKVNGKLYQRLGKIGSGGSSEVHKVISADCMIYALKKIKLKGRDYATAYGFCQEILYLNKLKGTSNIIQLIDYEVTDKQLLDEVMNGLMSHKEGRVKDDRYIYMVLEYGEIDLAHMLSQKWKEWDHSDTTINENWLRFYWQQILQAVNTIHEERIVHSDLKPANFLLVKGSLKLIDFGIAKAIMNDTTNIQRDSQVGTLSYMSPEAFMCDESDANGNVIKCGRPSDIWSLGCILYQMVYGRTPFSECKTFWAKFKVITDPNHEITYGPLSNPWLLDLMKKCLAWDRNERWRIPQLLQHPFLSPPVSHQLSLRGVNSCKAIQSIAESCPDDQQVSTLCCKLQERLTFASPASPNEQHTFLSEISSLCFQLQEHIKNTL